MGKPYLYLSSQDIDGRTYRYHTQSTRKHSKGYVALGHAGVLQGVAEWLLTP
jgi:hypothetical protein